MNLDDKFNPDAIEEEMIKKKIQEDNKSNDSINEDKRMFKYLKSKLNIPKIICLCGSTRFYKDFQQANFELTMKGNIVLSIGFYPSATNSRGEKVEKIHSQFLGISANEKIKLDELHKKKIDLADEIFVLNVGGYIGESTKSEIFHAYKTRKPVKFLEPENLSQDYIDEANKFLSTLNCGELTRVNFKKSLE